MKAKQLLAVVPLVVGLTLGLNACSFDVHSALGGDDTPVETVKAVVPDGWQTLADKNLGMSVSVPGELTVIYPMTDIASGDADALQSDANFLRTDTSHFKSSYSSSSVIAVDGTSGNNVDIQSPVKDEIPSATVVKDSLEKTITLQDFKSREATTALGKALIVDYENIGSDFSIHQAQVYADLGGGQAIVLAVSSGAGDGVWSDEQVVQIAQQVASSIDKAA